MVEFGVVDSSNQIETKAKAFTPISIALTQDTKDLQFADNVLDQNANLGKCSVIGFLFRIQWVKFCFFDRRLTVSVVAGYALIARVSQCAGLI